VPAGTIGARLAGLLTLGEALGETGLLRLWVGEDAACVVVAGVA
jgi:hypothetical protein